MAVFAGARIRDNNAFGTTTDNPLTNVATTLNSAGLANLSAVSGNHAVLVLDPLRTAGAPEIVIVTAHTAAATSATITRGAYGTTARQHAAGTLWVLAATNDDLIQVLAANPADNYEGQFWFRSDTDILMGHTGGAAVEAVPLGAWVAWTPTLTNLTLGNGTVTAKWTRHGRLIHYRFKFVLGSTSAVASGARFSLPATASSEYSVTAPLGDVSLLGSVNWRGMVWPATSGTLGRPVYFKADGTSGDITNLLPFTWATGHVIEATGAYEAAA